jgi:hypothetical protein
LCAILHFVQDDSTTVGVIHGIALKRNEKNKPLSSRANARDLTLEVRGTREVQPLSISLCEILHSVQDDGATAGVIHGVVLKWNEKK